MQNFINVCAALLLAHHFLLSFGFALLITQFAMLVIMPLVNQKHVPQRPDPYLTTPPPATNFIYYTNLIIITHLLHLSLCKLEFRARATNLNSDVRIAVKDVHYVHCNPEYIPSTVDGKYIPSTADDSTHMIYIHFCCGKILKYWYW